jgi:signal transduction histidine kinase/CheY-like chemotaxis protein
VPDVSCRAFSWFESCAELGLLDLEDVLSSAGVPLSVLSDKRQRVSWDTWMTLTDRAVDILGEDGLARTGDAVRGVLAGSLVRLAPSVADPRILLRIAFRYVGPSLYRPVAFRVDDLPDGRMSVEIEIPEPYRAGEAWLRSMPPALRTIPRFIGLPDAVVVVERLTPRRIVMTVTPPASHTWVARLGRSVHGQLRPSPLLEELDFHQQQLVRSERGVRSVLDALPAAVALHDGGELVHANAALRDLLGEVPEHLGALASPADADAWQQVLRGDATPRSVRLLRRGGPPVRVRANAMHDVPFQGRSVGAVFLLDRRSESAIDALEEVIPDLVIQIDGDVVVDVHAGTEHPRAEAMLRPLVGLPLTGVLEDLRSALLPDEVRRGLDSLMAARATGQVGTVRITSTWLGDERTYEVRVLPRPDQQLVLLVRDVTNTRLEQQRMVSERMATVGTLVAGVAHEINNTLTYLSGNLEWALQELRVAQVDDTVLAALGDALGGARRVERIVSQLRDLSRPQPPEPDPIDVADAVTTATGLVAAEIARAARLRIDAADAPRAFVDEQQLVQVLVNLLLNATQAIESGHAADNAITVSVDTTDDGWPRIRVQDTGRGVSPAVLGRLFEPFFTTRKQHGTGLGLAISHRMITDAGGRLEVESAEGVGTTFTIVLPPATEAPAPRRAPTPAPASERARILVVDDDEPVGRSIARLLREHDVTRVTSADEAAAWLEREPVDLIVCDLMMPGRDGLDLYDALPAALRERMLFLTGGVALQEHAERLERSGRPLLSKPITPQDLRKKVAELLRAPPRPG